MAFSGCANGLGAGDVLAHIRNATVQRRRGDTHEGMAMNRPVQVLLIVLMVLLLVALLPAWPYSNGWGYYPSGGFGLLLIVVVLLLLLGGRRV